MQYGHGAYPPENILPIFYEGRTGEEGTYSTLKMVMDVMDRTLVVDDELDICLMVTKHLQKLQFETDYALTVKDARFKVGRSTYEFIFLDLNLTDGSGFELIHYMKELNLSAKIIVISAHDNESTKALSMGAHLFVNKPFTMKTINDALRTLNFLPN